jgi:hypothetical protein
LKNSIFTTLVKKTSSGFDQPFINTSFQHQTSIRHPKQ